MNDRFSSLSVAIDFYKILGNMMEFIFSSLNHLKSKKNNLISDLL